MNPSPVNRMSPPRRWLAQALLACLVVSQPLTSANLYAQTRAVAPVTVAAAGGDEAIVREAREAFAKISKPEISFEQFLSSRRDHARVRVEQQSRQRMLVGAPPASMCFNGDFTQGTTGWGGLDGHFPPLSLPNSGLLSGVISASTSHQTLVPWAGEIGPQDPYAPINMSGPSGSGNSVRIGNAVNGGGAEALTKTFVVTQATVNYWYALVLEDPGHDKSIQPGFGVEIFDAFGNDITAKTVSLGSRSPRAVVDGGNSFVVSDSANPFFKTSSKLGPDNAKVLYKDWSCASIDLGDLIGKTVTIRWVTRDCGAGGHAGWAYVDDFCATCAGSPGGSLTFDPTTSTDCGSGKLCFKVQVPKDKGPLGVTTGTATVTVKIYQNGNVVATLPAITATADGEYCVTVNPSILPSPFNVAQGGFDWTANASYAIGGYTGLPPQIIGAAPNGVKGGLNDDYKVSCGPVVLGAGTCCPPMDNATISGLFGHSGNTANTYQETFGGGAQGPANVAAFFNNYNAYLTLVKWSCPSVTQLQVTFSLYSTTALGGPLSGTPLPGGVSTVTFTGTPPTPPAFFTTALNNNQFYGIRAVTVPLDATGREVKCGFDAKCLDDDRYTWIHSIGSRLSGPAGPTTGK